MQEREPVTCPLSHGFIFTSWDLLFSIRTRRRGIQAHADLVFVLPPQQSAPAPVPACPSPPIPLPQHSLRTLPQPALPCLNPPCPVKSRPSLFQPFLPCPSPHILAPSPPQPALPCLSSPLPACSPSPPLPISEPREVLEEAKTRRRKLKPLKWRNVPNPA